MPPKLNTTSQDIINFWFNELTPKQWWGKDLALDHQIRITYGLLHYHASRGELWEWRDTPEGRLAEILILDQFSRHIFRNQAQAFAYDSIALVLAQESIHLKIDLVLEPQKRAFLYLPFMHSESRKMHEIAIKLYSAHGLEENLEFEVRHKKIIDTFGRYPHRNAILGRTSTKEEFDFLEEEGSSF